MGEPRTHVLRPPIPWRDSERRTECGLDPERIHPDYVIERDELVRRMKRDGQQRTYVLTCVTCLNTANRWPTWEQSPSGFMGRLVNPPMGQRDEERARVDAELRAMVELVGRHRALFGELVALPRLEAVRSQRRRSVGRG